MAVRYGIDSLGKNVKKLIGTYWFIIGIGVVLGLAYVAADTGIFLYRYNAHRAAVIAIFLMSGMTTPMKRLGEDVKKWRCHLLVQMFSFAVIPALFFFTSGWLPDGPVRYGVFLVAVLPTTVSSCVVFTTAVGGRVSCAVLNTVGGNLLGIVLSPLLLGLLIGYGGAVEFAAVSRSIPALCMLVLLPFAAGRACGCVLPDSFSARVKGVQSYAAQACVLVIMFCAFSKSSSDLAESLGALWKCFLYLAVAHVVLVAAAMACVRALRLPEPVAAAALFCSTQKTLAMGVPLAFSFFGNTDTAIALILLPLVFYYLFQLLFGGLLIPYWSNRIAVSAGQP